MRGGGGKGGALVVVVVVAAMSAAAGIPAPAEGAKPPAVVSADCHGHNFKPGRIILACADEGLYVEHLTWKHWGRREANGIGTGVGKTCEPFCAAGGTKSGGMEIRLFKPKLCGQDGRVHFTRMRYRWTNGSPIRGQPDQGTIPSPCDAV